MSYAFKAVVRTKRLLHELGLNNPIEALEELKRLRAERQEARAAMAVLERADPDAAACLAAEVLGRQASTIGPRVLHFADDGAWEGLPALRVEVYKGEVAASRKAQLEAVARHKAEIGERWRQSGITVLNDPCREN